jgi:hypothetical protein
VLRATGLRIAVKPITSGAGPSRGRRHSEFA